MTKDGKHYIANIIMNICKMLTKVYYRTDDINSRMDSSQFKILVNTVYQEVSKSINYFDYELISDDLPFCLREIEVLNFFC